MRFQVLRAAGMKYRVFWDVAPCSLTGVTDTSEVRTASIIRAIADSLLLDVYELCLQDAASTI
jgi:hypothetical protein